MKKALRHLQDTVDKSDEEIDEVDSSRAPLIDHLIELRQRLIYAVAAFFVMFLGCFAIAGQIYNVLVWPYVWASGDDSVRLIATHFLEQLFTHIKLAMFGAGVLSFPIVATQIYKFVAPGLYSNEKQAFWPYLVATPIFFALGAAVVYFVVMPLLITFSIGLTQTGSDGQTAIELMPKVSEYLSLIMTLVFGFGLCFQLPIILTLLARIGVVTAQNLIDFRKYAIVAIFAVAAVLTPPDAISMFMMGIPTTLLYELSIFAVARAEKARATSETPAGDVDPT